MMASIKRSPSKSNKRLVRQFDNVGSIDTPTSLGDKTTLHAVVTALSPQKGKFFDGSISDDSGSMRVVGFTEAKRVKLEKLFKEKQPVKLADFRVQKAYSGEDSLEVVISDNTTIDTSEKKFKMNIPEPVLSEEATHMLKVISLNLLKAQPQFQRIIVIAKVISIDEIKVLDDGKQVKTILIYNKTGETKLDLWKNHVGMLTIAKTYTISNAMVKVYHEEYSLTTPKDGTMTLEEADDIPDILPLQSVTNKRSLHGARVVGVRTLTTKILCVSCTTGEIILSDRNPSLGTCTKCAITVLVSECVKETTADLLVVSQTFRHYLTVKGEQLTTLAAASEDDITEETLLMSATFDCEYHNHTITSVTRK